MPYELTVSDKLSSWGFGGRIYQPGIYVVDKETAEAADHAFISVREISEDEAQEDEEFSGADSSGPLTKADIEFGSDTENLCPAGCGVTLKSKRSIERHMKRTHPNWAPPEPAAATENETDSEPEDGEFTDDVDEEAI